MQTVNEPSLTGFLGWSAPQTFSERTHVTAATVQDFLERYEVGETVGVGGKRGGPLYAVCLADLGRQAFLILLLLIGFAVVKKGRDKKTGDPVAIKVGMKRAIDQGPATQTLNWKSVLCRW